MSKQERPPDWLRRNPFWTGAGGSASAANQIGKRRRRRRTRETVSFNLSAPIAGSARLGPIRFGSARFAPKPNLSRRAPTPIRLHARLSHLLLANPNNGFIFLRTPRSAATQRGGGSPFDTSKHPTLAAGASSKTLTRKTNKRTPPKTNQSAPLRVGPSRRVAGGTGARIARLEQLLSSRKPKPGPAPAGRRPRVSALDRRHRKRPAAAQPNRK